MYEILEKTFEDRNNYVYVMQTSDNTVKVGRSKNPEKRLKNLQTGNPNEIKLIDTIKSEFSSEIERQFRHKHDDKRIKGEHYNLSQKEAMDSLSKIKSKLDTETYAKPDKDGWASPFSDTYIVREIRK